MGNHWLLKPISSFIPLILETMVSAVSNCKLSGLPFSSGVCIAQEFTQREIIVTGSQLKCIGYDSRQPLGSSGFLVTNVPPTSLFPSLSMKPTLREKEMGKREGQETNQTELYKH